MAVQEECEVPQAKLHVLVSAEVRDGGPSGSGSGSRNSGSTPMTGPIHSELRGDASATWARPSMIDYAYLVRDNGLRI